MKKALFLGAAMTFGSIAAFASEIDFTYNLNNEEYKVYGFQKKEAYDVAIKIDDPGYVGAKVTGITVGLPVDPEAVSDISAWLSTELKLENKVNAPDICSKKGEVVEDWLNVTFDEPYKIPAEGVWVGYSFNITDISEEFGWGAKPIACIESEQNLDNGLWLHSSRSRLQWTNSGATLKAVSTMIVHLSTDFGAYDVAVGVPADSYMVVNEATSVPVKLTNHGQVPLESLTYSYTLGEMSGKGSLHLDEPLEALGKSATVSLPIEAYPEMGEFPFTVTLETSNGEVNSDPYKTSSGTMNVWPVIPVTRPLVEEYTGLRCGYCPRGYVAMEEMSKMYGDLFVGMAFHTQTYEVNMVTVRDADFPVVPGGFPAGDINRGSIVDPSTLPDYWPEAAAVIVPMAVDVTAEWSDDKSVLKADAEITFVKDMDTSDYTLSMALVADGLHDEKWLQTNYYSGQKEGDGMDIELWDVFLNGPSKVPGLVFNDVVAYYEDIHGIEGSIPESVKRGEPISYHYEVEMDKVKTIYGADFLCDGCTLKAVAIVLDKKTDKAVNCNKSNSLLYDASAGIDQINDAPAEVVAEEYHNLQGIRVLQPEKGGIYIRTEILSDGSMRTSKVRL